MSQARRILVDNVLQKERKRWREKDPYGCEQSIGAWMVSAYLQVDISVIELIIALGSEHTNLTWC